MQKCNDCFFSGYNLKRSSVYLRLLPKSTRTQEGKPHVKVAPVQFIRAQNDEHKNQKGMRFAKATINAMEEVAGILSPQKVTFHTQDDKAKVAIGLPAAKKQVPIIMHMEYQVQLPNRDYVVAPMDKLIPSVIADMKSRRCSLKKQLSTQALPLDGTHLVAVRGLIH